MNLTPAAQAGIGTPPAPAPDLRPAAPAPDASHPHDDAADRIGIWAQALCWALLALVWFAPLGNRALLSPDEGRYATIAWEMLRSGDWITPRLNGFVYFEKPALGYWLGAASLHLFGLNEFGARFWPALAGFLSIAAVAVTARRLWGRNAGAAAAMAMAGSTWVVANAHFLSLDMGLTFFLTLALCGFLLSQHEEASARQRRHAIELAWAAMACAVLTKGLVGIVIPAATLVLYSAWTRQWAFWRRLHWGSGTAIFLAITVPWFVAVSLRNPEFAQFFFVHEHFQRYLTDEAKRTASAWYFVPLLAVGLMPWTTMLPALGQRALARASGAAFQPLRFLAAWSAFVFVFFSASHSKLPSYILPMFPALALMLGEYLAAIAPRQLARHLVAPVAGALAVLALAPFAGHYLRGGTPAEVAQALALSFATAAAVFLAFAALASLAIRRARRMAAVLAVCAGSVIAVTIALDGHDEHGVLKSSRNVAVALAPYVTPDTELFSVAMYDQTFPFYMRRHVTLVHWTDEFALGQRREPQRSIPTVAQFAERWNTIARGAAMMNLDTYRNLAHGGLPMRIVYEDPRRVVVVKP